MANNSSLQPNIEEIRDLLSPYLDGEVTDGERLLVEQAVAASPQLRHELDSLRRTVAMVAALPSMPAPRPFTLTAADVQVAAPPPRRWFKLPAWAGGLAMAAVAIMCVLAAGGLFISQFGGGALAPAQIARLDESAATQAAPAAESAAEAVQEEVLVEQEVEVAQPEPETVQEAAEAAPAEEDMAMEAAEPVPVEQLVEEAPAAKEAAPAEEPPAAAVEAAPAEDPAAEKAAPAEEMAAEGEEAAPAEEPAAAATENEAAPAAEAAAEPGIAGQEADESAPMATEAAPGEGAAASTAAAPPQPPQAPGDAAADSAAASEEEAEQQLRTELAPQAVEIQQQQLRVSPGLIRLEGIIEAPAGANLSATLQRDGQPFSDWADPATLQSTVQAGGRFELAVQARAGQSNRDLLAAPAAYALIITTVNNAGEPIEATVFFDAATALPAATSTPAPTVAPQPTASPTAAAVDRATAVSPELTSAPSQTTWPVWGIVLAAVLVLAVIGLILIWLKLGIKK